MALRVPQLPGFSKKDTAALFQVGEEVGRRYEILEELGRGGSSIVLRARDLRLDREVALKAVIRGQTSEQRSWLASTLEREAKVLARLQHDNIVSIHDLGEHRRCPFIVMELIEGESLAALLYRQVVLPLDVTLTVLREVAAALDFAHSRGVVHRDVKPANVLYGRDYRISLVDFGLVSIVGQIDGEKHLSGTPPYMAPEVAAMKEIPEDERHLIDVYGLAAMAFEMLTGAPPFGRGGESVLPMVREADAPRIRSQRHDLPEQFDTIFARALAKQPRARHPSASAFAAELDAAVRQTEGQREILVVDDDEDIRFLFSAAFEVAFPDANVMCAEDGLVAFQLARVRRPSLITVDLDMPRVNGAELCLALRTAEDTRDIPIVVISGRIDDESRDLLHENGVEIAAKPIQPRNLIKLATRLLEPGTAAT